VMQSAASALAAPGSGYMGSPNTRAAVALDLDGGGDRGVVTNKFNGRLQVLGR
jgi:hypothetical protein